MGVIRDAEQRLVSSVNWLETSMVLMGRNSDPASWARFDAFIARTEMQIVPHDRLLAYAAREAFLLYGKGRHPASLNLGDCAAYALAKTRGLPLLFKGGHFSQTDLVAAV